MAFDVLLFFSPSSFTPTAHSRVRVSMKAIVSCFFYIYLKDAQKRRGLNKKNLTHDRYSAPCRWTLCNERAHLKHTRRRKEQQQWKQRTQCHSVYGWLVAGWLFFICLTLLPLSCFSGETTCSAAVGSCLKRAQVTFICCQVNKLRQRRRVRKTKGFNKVCDSCLVNCFTRVLNQLGSEPFFICLTWKSLDYFT